MEQGGGEGAGHRWRHSLPLKHTHLDCLFRVLRSVSQSFFFKGRDRRSSLHSLTVGLLQESTSRLYWITRSNVTATDKSFALGWYCRPTVPTRTASFNESSNQKPPMMENRVSESWRKLRAGRVFS